MVAQMESKRKASGIREVKLPQKQRDTAIESLNYEDNFNNKITKFFNIITIIKLKLCK